MAKKKKNISGSMVAAGGGAITGLSSLFLKEGRVVGFDDAKLKKSRLFRYKFTSDIFKGAFINKPMKVTTKASRLLSKTGLAISAIGLTKAALTKDESVLSAAGSHFIGAGITGTLSQHAFKRLKVFKAARTPPAKDKLIMARKNVTPSKGKIIFRRIRGRLIPIRRK